MSTDPLRGYEIGQRVRVIKSLNGILVGKEAIVLSGPFKNYSPPVGHYVGQAIDILGHPSSRPSGNYCCPISWLEPIDKPPQREQLGEWSLCPWQPREEKPVHVGRIIWEAE